MQNMHHVLICNVHNRILQDIRNMLKVLSLCAGILYKKAHIFAPPLQITEAYLNSRHNRNLQMNK